MSTTHLESAVIQQSNRLDNQRRRFLETIANHFDFFALNLILTSSHVSCESWQVKTARRARWALKIP